MTEVNGRHNSVNNTNNQYISLGIFMFKKIAIVGVAIAAAYLGSTWYVGKTAQEQLVKNAELDNARLKQYLGDLVYYSVEDYQAGLFTSTATYRLNINLPNFKRQIDQRYTIQNGPLPWADLQQGDFAPKRYSYDAELVKNDFIEPLFSLADKPMTQHAKVGFDNSESGTYQITPIKVDKTHDEAQFKIDFAGFNTEYTLHREPYKIQSHGTIPSLSLEVGDQDIKFDLIAKDWVIESNYDLSQDRVNGQTKSTVGSMQYLIDDIKIDLNGLDAQDQIQDDSQLISVQSQTKAKALIIDDMNLGGLEYQVAYNKIDSTAGKQIFNIVMALVKEAAMNIDTFSEKKFEEMIMREALKLGALSITALSHGPELQYGPIRLFTDKGSVDFAMKLGFLPPNLSKLNEPGFDEYSYMLSLLKHAEFELSGNAAWVEDFSRKLTLLAYKKAKLGEDAANDFNFDKISQMLEQGLVDSELFKKEGERVVLKVSVKAPENKTLEDVETVTVNGQEYPFNEETAQLFNTRLEKADEILMDNGFYNAVELIVSPLQFEDAIDDYAELEESEQESLLDCQPDDQECLELEQEMQKALESATAQ